MVLERLKKIIGKMFSGEISGAERIELAEEQPLASLLEEQWHKGKEWHQVDHVDGKEIWKDIADKCWNGKKSHDGGIKKFSIATIGWIAASAAALLIVWLMDFTPSYTIVKAPLEAKRFVQLPDSSKVWLNVAACIKYRKDFCENRVVELEGEGFFDVKKRNGSAFIVRVGEANIEVKGTEFNVKRISAVTTVTLFTGSVEFSASAFNERFLMKPGAQIVYDEQSKEVRFEEVDVKEYDWRTGGYRFVDKPLKALIDFVNRNYDVDIVLGERVNKEVLFTGTIRMEESLMDILDKVCISMDLNMKTDDGKNIELY